MADDNGYVFKTKDVMQDELKVYNVSAEEIDVDFKFKDTVSNLIQNYNLKILQKNVLLTFWHAPCWVPQAKEEALNSQVEEWLRCVIIRKSTSDTVVVTKKKNRSFRICIDFRQLNDMMLKDASAISIVDDVLQKLGKFFITMDLENGFFHS